MTIITDAQTIRDETATGANTAARVGGNLVDIATQVTQNQQDIAANTASILTLKDFGARLSMRDNATGTTITNAGTFYKIAGTTTESFSAGFTLTNNRMTYAPADNIARGFLITATISATCATGNHDLRVRLSVNGTTDPATEVKSYTASGRSNAVTLSGTYLLNYGDFVEIFITDDAAGETMTVTHLQMTASPYSAKVISSYCYEAIQYFNSLAVQPSEARKAIYNDAIVALKDAGIWSLADAIQVYAAADQPAALMDWKRLTSGSWTAGDGAFVADGGFANGLTSYLSTGFNPSTDGVNYQQDSACIAVMLRNYTGGSGIILSASDMLITTDIGYIEGDVYGFVNSGADNPTTQTTASPEGLLIVQRTGATAVAAYVDNVAAGTSSEPSTAVPDAVMWTGNNDSGFDIAADWVFMYAGAPLDNTQRAALKTIIDNYLAAIAAL